MPEPNHHMAKVFTKNSLAIEMRKTQILLNNPIHLGFLILYLNKTVIYEFQYGYVKPKYRENAKSCYTDTDSSIIHMKTDDIYKYTAEDVEKSFDTLHFELETLSLKGKIKKVIGLMKVILHTNIMKEFVGLRPKIYNYLIDDGSEDR